LTSKASILSDTDKQSRMGFVYLTELSNYLTSRYLKRQNTSHIEDEPKYQIEKRISVKDEPIN